MIPDICSSSQEEGRKQGPDCIMLSVSSAKLMAEDEEGKVVKGRRRKWRRLVKGQQAKTKKQMERGNREKWIRVGRNSSCIFLA